MKHCNQSLINAVNSIPEDDCCKCFDNWFSRMFCTLDRLLIAFKNSPELNTILVFKNILPLAITLTSTSVTRIKGGYKKEKENR
ncbi:hypothetical protein LAZ67_15000581 [Cordylochernes scorpioides]|uniref:Uncharacterized protein n=1 Tax=Cordylochernes scorpioides TaxID=51811 RepID=A0ABY6L867_9ARAC|nr:hypothetical protein LAZ67_15000581 [Cordylochernes scorpioides]